MKMRADRGEGRWVVGRAIALLAGATLTAWAPAGVRAETAQWTYASGWPKEHVQVGVIADEWISRIQKATEGRVKIRHVPGGTLLKPEATLDGVRKGVANCGPWVTGYKPGALPITTTLMGSMDVDLGNQLDIKGIAAISSKLLEEFPEFRKEFAELGVRPMMWVPTAPYVIISKKPARNLSDLAGQKLRAFGTVLPKFQEAMGAVPVSVANAEMYTSIQTGVIDGAMTDTPQMVTAKLYEVAKNVLLTGPGMGTNLAGASVVYLCNESSWKALSEADQKAITDVTAGMADYLAKAMVQTSESALKSLREHGVTVSNLTAAELASLKSKAPLFDESAKALDSRGLPGTAIAKRYRELASDYLSGVWKP
jgi:TRAP-type C4-dicarboxylate transport system substrate-binding protein